MKKVIFYAVFLCLFSSFLTLSSPVFAQALGKALDQQETGLLPSNPFYFLTKLSHSVKRALTFDALKKFDVDLDNLNREAAELQKLAKIAPNKTGAITNAAVTYQSDLDSFINHTDNLKELGVNESIEKLLDRIVELSLNHAGLFEELAHAFSENDSLAIKFRAITKNIIKFLGTLPTKLEKVESFKVRFQQIINGQEHDFKELKGVRVLTLVAASLPEGLPRHQIEALKKDLLLRFNVQLGQGLSIENFELVFIDPIARLRVLDEVRKGIDDQELKNQLNILRQKALDQIIKDNLVASDEAQAAIDEASKALVELGQRGGAQNFVDQAKFYFDQANNFFSQGNFSGAFSHAVLTTGAVDDALWQFSRSTKEAQNELTGIKKEFDRLTTIFKLLTLSKNRTTEIIDLLTQAEKLIAKVSDGKSANVQEIKTILANVDVLLAKAKGKR